jgi:hypothetical protein
MQDSVTVSGRGLRAEKGQSSETAEAIAISGEVLMWRFDRNEEILNCNVSTQEREIANRGG